MSRPSFARFVLAGIAIALLSLPSQAQLFRAYLALGPAGNDANPCSLTLPCRLLPAALAAVADGGEIWMLDSANYNSATVSIDKSVSILAVPGALGSIVATGGPAVSITASGLKVSLRNLVIVPLPGGGATSGIVMTGASALVVEDSLIANLPGLGILMNGGGSAKIANTTFRDNAEYAVQAENGAYTSISNSRMFGNFGGVLAQSITSSTTVANVSDSIISGGNVGVLAFGFAAGCVANLSVTRTTIEKASQGLSSQSNAGGSTLVTVSGSMIANNFNAWYQAGAGSVVRSLGNNHLSNNVQSTGSLTTAALQ